MHVNFVVGSIIFSVFPSRGNLTPMLTAFIIHFACVHRSSQLNTAAVQLPIGLEDSHSGVVDVISGRAFHFSGVKGENVEEIDVPEDMKVEFRSSPKGWRPVYRLCVFIQHRRTHPSSRSILSRMEVVFQCQGGPRKVDRHTRRGMLYHMASIRPLSVLSGFTRDPPFHKFDNNEGSSRSVANEWPLGLRSAKIRWHDKLPLLDIVTCSGL